MPAFETTTTLLLLWAVIGYGLGSIPFGLLLTRMMGLGNLRDIGSGNIGTTNVLRTGSKAAAAMTLLFDGGKGAAAVLLARSLAGEDAAQLAGLAAFLGHCFPIWLGFKGGKGVATFLGLMLALAWPVGIACCATWLASAALSRISSMGALGAALSAPLWALLLNRSDIAALAALLAAIVVWRHSANIIRIRTGTEPKIGQK
ncbi:glycerol-3-phosphate 1-O-acyltransferase PlsY [Parasedimentitalea psychrophila]|uniref:Glycerol-3-phosphate acyltransferase n=1 Tax=Parasedimentitalea psychrophila TaxID=2997337 RepID=A0A9Y2P260_9RHOB|nr:glycerol-3-phosphate 1-O-acyltransferase PlsY [Parasedimentitalea psychrophila]WIY26296.1 glycerol-3-phosphate 1-O-acyltransferase PlsY [Parasedimentitalea psychrophila]